MDAIAHPRRGSLLAELISKFFIIAFEPRPFHRAHVPDTLKLAATLKGPSACMSMVAAMAGRQRDPSARLGVLLGSGRAGMAAFVANGKASEKFYNAPKADPAAALLIRTQMGKAFNEENTHSLRSAKNYGDLHSHAPRL